MSTRTNKPRISAYADDEDLIVPLEDLIVPLELPYIIEYNNDKFEMVDTIVPLEPPELSVQPFFKKKVEEIDLKYPFDIKNLRIKEVNSYDDFGFTKQKVYDVSCFSSMQYITKQLGYKTHTEYPDYQYRVYSYRAVSKAKDTTLITKLRVIRSFDHYKKFIHINIELLG